MRFRVDLRGLNAVTEKDVYPLPNTEDCIQTLEGMKFFSSLDLNNGYFQIAMKSEGKKKTAFITQDGLYEFNVMPFGLKNAPATFQRTMDILLSGLKWNACIVYFEEHLENLEQVNENTGS